MSVAAYVLLMLGVAGVIVGLIILERMMKL